MLIRNKKYYLITHYNTFYRAKYIKDTWCDVSDFTFYQFRGRTGDLFFYHRDDRYVNFITEDFNEAKMEIVNRLYKGNEIKRSPFDNEKLLHYYLTHFPEKFI